MEMSEREENLRDAMRDDSFWDGSCQSTTTAGEHCARTVHLTGLHSWERCGHLNLDPTGTRVLPWKCIDCGVHLSQRECLAIIASQKLLSKET